MEREIKRNRQGRILSYEIVNSTDTYGVIALEKNVKLFTSQSFYINQSAEITELEIEAPTIIGYSNDVNRFVI
jgi:phosphohistidine swiveling domain-containing protein